jgi:ABC-type nitrate/sulfonate/bicarbonate transport system ATPase subunit
VDAGAVRGADRPSGSGKTTLLWLIAGLVSQPLRSPPHDDTRAPRPVIGYMPQRDLLLPWRSALDNASAGLEVRGVPRAEGARAGAVALQQFGPTGFERVATTLRRDAPACRLPRTVLAGGLLLLDEPSGA